MMTTVQLWAEPVSSFTLRHLRHRPCGTLRFYFDGVSHRSCCTVTLTLTLAGLPDFATSAPGDHFNVAFHTLSVTRTLCRLVLISPVRVP